MKNGYKKAAKIDIKAHQPKREESRPGHNSNINNSISMALKTHIRNSATKRVTDYTEPVLFSADGDVNRDWYIHFWFTDYSISSNPVRIRLKLGINRHKNFQQRTKQCGIYMQALSEMLADGFNPLAPTTEYVNEPPIAENFKSILEAIKPSITLRTYYSYSSIVNKFIEQNDYGFASQITKQSLILWRDQILKKATNKTANNAIGVISLCLNKMVDRGLISSNPCAGIKKLKTSKGSNREIWSNQEIEIVKKEFSGTPGMLVVVGLIYYCGLRPLEIIRLKVGAINIDQGIIQIKSSDAKDRTGSLIRIPEGFKNQLYQFIDGSEKNMFLISRKFKPGVRMLSRNTISTTFKTRIKLKHGIKKDLYAFKHTSITRLLGMNIPAKTIQQHYRHDLITITDHYASSFTVTANDPLLTKYPVL